MAPMRSKADTNKLKQASSYKSKLRPRKKKELAAPPPSSSSSSPNKSRKRKMSSKISQAAVQKLSPAKSGTRATAKNKRSAPPPNEKNVLSKKRKFAATVVANVKKSPKALQGKKKRPPPPPELSNVEKQKYSFKSPYPQQYSFPGNIIFYAAKNPLYPSGHLKLIKSCKSLFRMSRIIPVENLRKECFYDSDEDDDEDDNEKDDSDEENSDIDDSDVDSDLSKQYDKDSWEANDGAEFISIKNQFFKLWIYDKLYIDDERNPCLASTLIKRIHLCTLRKLTLEHQNLTFDELQIFVGGGELEKIYLSNAVIKNSDGTVTEFGKVFDAICCRNMIISLPDQQNGITRITSKKIVEVLESEKAALDVCVRLMNIPEAFDFEAITGFLKANMDQEKHTIDLEFAKNLSDAYKNGLQEYVNEIIKIRGIYAHTLPIITFPGENPTALEELQKMRYDEDFDGILQKPGTDRVRRKLALMCARRCRPF